jgi:hypothetical protein
MEELVATLEAIREKEARQQKFMAAIQGIDLDGNQEEIQETNDIVDLSGWKADKEGFGIGQGLGYVVQGG